MTVSIVVLIFVLAVSVLTDVRTGKIKNWLTLPAIASGPVIHLIQSGSKGATSSLQGLGVMFLVAAVLLTLKIMGGGDAKLLVAIGALTGFALVQNVLFFTAIAGGLLAVLVLVAQRKATTVIGRMVRTLWLKFGYGVKDPAGFVSSRTKLPYSIAIAAGTVVALFLQP
jgi:prepilin peptidase CpaA